MLLGFKTELKLNDRQRTQLACALWSKLLRHLNCMSKKNQSLVGWASRPP